MLLVVLVWLSWAGTNSVAETEPFFSYKIAAVYPHDPSAFTQGLVYHNGFIYEGTGLYGASSLRQVRLNDGVVTKGLLLPDNYFGEGIAIVDDRIYQLTWQENTGFVYDLNSFALLDRFTYPTEGWGLTYDGEYLIMSDGSSVLTYLDPQDYSRVKQIAVTSLAGPVEHLNELEYIDGVIFANIWLEDLVVMIDPENGEVLGWIDFSELRTHLNVDPNRIDVLNGIAYIPETDQLVITGKLWPAVFAVEVGERPVKLESKP
ncbi:MAG TPA: glutaminyl-peptide cyclotransferase [Firmicutes bacterium]|nr:glutaminyl-peptide cyclotransferase [Bacillota bacterium]